MSFGRVVVDILTARHQPIADRAVRLVERCEQKFGFDTGVKRVVVLPGKAEGRYLPRDWWFVGGTIKIHPAPPRSRELAEYVFHEMGHAIRERYETDPWLGGLCRVSHADAEAYERASDAAAARPRRAGYVSGYATCDRDEDFCETLAAYLTNRKTWRSELRFGGALVSVRGDARLRRKLDAVHELLGELHRFE